MKKERNIERILNQIEVVPNSTRKRLGLEKLLKMQDKHNKTKSVGLQPTFRRIIMNRIIWKIAASIAIATAVIGVIGILQNGNQAAYAFSQTVAAMQNKQSFHIITYWGKPTDRKDEYWAEFDIYGKLIKFRQLDWFDRFGTPDHPPIETIWENQVKYSYEPTGEPDEPGILLVTNTKYHENMEGLEEFNPETSLETMLSDLNEQIENGLATVTIDDSLTLEGFINIEVIKEV